LHVVQVSTRAICQEVRQYILNGHILPVVGRLGRQQLNLGVSSGYYPRDEADMLGSQRDGPAKPAVMHVSLLNVQLETLFAVLPLYQRRGAVDGDTQD
jgi:hypothetical protein